MTSLNNYRQINQSFCWSVGLVCRQCFFCFDQSKRSSAVQQKHSQLESLGFGFVCFVVLLDFYKFLEFLLLLFQEIFCERSFENFI